MFKKRYLLLVFFPITLHLYCLFFLHFYNTFKPKYFEHGFKETYSRDVPEQDYKKLDTILMQPFHYLGNGKQMMAFESSDGKYVLKLFNPMRPLKKGWYKRWGLWKRYSSLKWISREWFGKKSRLKKLFKRHHLAYELLRDETGLIFVHLAQDKQISHFVHLTDQSGKKHILQMEKTPFVIQEKAILVPWYLKTLIEEKKYTEAKEAVAGIDRLFKKRVNAQITDRIQTMENNYGFVGKRPIQIDVGRIRIDRSLGISEQNRVINNFHSWLLDTFPELHD